MKSSKRSTNAGLSRLFFASGDSATGKLITNVGWTSVGSTFSSNTSFQSFHAGASAPSVMPRAAAAEAALPLEVGGDPQVEVQVERVVVGLARPRDGAGRDGLHHRRFHLEERPRIEELPQRLDHTRAEEEDGARVGIHHEIHVALAVARLDVLQAVPLLGE